MSELLQLSRDKYSYQERQQVFAGHEADSKNLPDKQTRIPFEDCSTLDVKSYEPKIFTTFEAECRTAYNIKAYIEFSGSHTQGEK